MPYRNAMSTTCQNSSAQYTKPVFMRSSRGSFTDESDY